MNKIKFLIIAFLATIVFASCSEDEPARMLWEVSATPSENVKAAFDPSFYDQIQIKSDGEGGEVTLKCTNYKMLTLDAKLNSDGEYVDTDCHFTAKITTSGEIKIILDKMQDGFKETSSYLHIKGNNDKNISFTTVSINRKP